MSNLRKCLESQIGCNEAMPRGVLWVRHHEREPMLKNKKILVLVTAGVVALGYAVVSTNAFADTTLPPTAVVALPAPTAPALPTGIPAPSGIQAPTGLSSNPSSMPTSGDDDADDQVGNQSDDQAENQSGDQSDGASANGDDDGDNSSVAVSTSLASENGGDSNQNNDGQDGSGSND